MIINSIRCSRCEKELTSAESSPYNLALAAVISAWSPLMDDVSEDILCGLCLIPLAEYIHPSLKDDAGYIADIDQIQAMIRDYESKSSGPQGV